MYTSRAALAVVGLELSQYTAKASHTAYKRFNHESFAQSLLSELCAVC